jgi:hypothetical protein
MKPTKLIELYQSLFIGGFILGRKREEYRKMKSRFFLIFVFLMVFILSGCIVPSDLDSSPFPTPTFGLSVTSVTPTIYSQAVVPVVSVTPTTYSQTVVPSVTVLSAKTLVANEACPEPDHSGLLSNGTLFWSMDEGGNQYQIYGVSALSSTPLRLFQSTSSNFPNKPSYSRTNHFMVFPEQDEIGWIHEETDLKKLELIILNLKEQKEKKIELTLPWYYSLKEWESKNQFIFIADGYDAQNNQIYMDEQYFDPITNAYAHQENKFKLPDYPFLPEDKWFSFEYFFSINSEKNNVLYTSEGASGKEIVLFNLVDQEPLWRTKVYDSSFLPEPAWTNSLDLVAFSYPNPEGKQHHYDIYTLNGKAQFTLFDLGLITPAYGSIIPEVRFLKWSPSDRYLYFLMGGFPSEEGSGYILDTKSLNLKNVCDLDVLNIRDGRWLPESNQLI